MERVWAGEREILLVGTAHISEESVKEVELVLESEKPDVVGVELDVSRFHQLKYGRRWSETNVGEIIRSGKTYLFLLNLLLAGMQRKIGASVGVKPGAEMLAAIRLAEKHSIPAVLLDRDVQVTMRRAFRLMGLGEKIRTGLEIISGFFGEKEPVTKELIEEMKGKDLMGKLMEELSEKAPTIKKVLVDERDEFIAQQILRSPGKKILAVVGAGHVEGIKRHLAERKNISCLLSVPKKRSTLKYVKYLVPGAFAAVIAYAFFVKGFALGIQVFALWFLINGSLSALGAAIARAHPFSVLAAFLAAPFTSLHPAIAAGWFAGMVEAKFSQPKVKDFEALGELNSFRDFGKNKVTKILLVTAYANVGSVIGTVIALPYIVALLF